MDEQVVIMFMYAPLIALFIYFLVGFFSEPFQ